MGPVDFNEFSRLIAARSVNEFSSDMVVSRFRMHCLGTGETYRLLGRAEGKGDVGEERM
jgi:hypothetical protein